MSAKSAHALLMALVLSLGSAPVFADKPAWAGGGKNDVSDNGNHGKGHKKGGQHGRNGGDGDVNIRIGAYFGGTQREAVHDYYGSQFKSGKCPPGLAKKHNGCQPPGQAKKWSTGHVLPSDVVYYSVPPTLVARLGPPPAGHKYIRVASDILLITIGTSMVVDAIQDLGGM